MKMDIDGPTNDKAKTHFDFFCNVKKLLGFVAIFSLLQLFHNLIKFGKLQDVVICDFMATKKKMPREDMLILLRLEHKVQV